VGGARRTNGKASDGDQSLALRVSITHYPPTPTPLSYQLVPCEPEPPLEPGPDAGRGGVGAAAGRGAAEGVGAGRGAGAAGRGGGAAGRGGGAAGRGALLGALALLVDEGALCDGCVTRSIIPLAISPRRLMPSRASVITVDATAATFDVGADAGRAAFRFAAGFLAADFADDLLADDFLRAADFRLLAARFRVEPRFAAPRAIDRFDVERLRPPLLADARRAVDRFADRDDLRFVAMMLLPESG